MANTRTFDVSISDANAASLTIPWLFDRAAFATNANADELFSPTGGYGSTNGGCIRTKQSSSEIARQIVEWTQDTTDAAQDGSCEIWVLVAFDGSGAATVTFEYGDNTLTDYARGATYGSDAVFANDNGRWHISEGTGATVGDSTANQNDGSISGTPSWSSSGQIGPALSVSTGSTQYANCGNPAGGELDFGSTSFTILYWLNSSDTNSFTLGKRNAGTAAGYDLGLDGSNKPYGAIADGSTRVQSALGTAVGGVFVHVAMVIDRSSNLLKLYQDGSHVTGDADISSVGSISNSYAFTIGARADSDAYDGLIDEVQVIPSILSAAAIAAIYSNQNDPTANITVGNPSAINSAPVITASQSFNIATDAITGDLVGLVACTDADGDTIAAAKESGGTATTSDSAFVLAPTSPESSYFSIKINDTTSFQTAVSGAGGAGNSLTYDLQASDGTAYGSAVTVTINIVNPPSGGGDSGSLDLSLGLNI